MSEPSQRHGLILGLETSTHSGGAALLRPMTGAGGEACIDGGSLVGSVTFSTMQLYSQRLLPSIQWLLERSQTSMQDVGVVGIAVGPGSFTGLRIGLSVAKALAYASGGKIVGVSTLEALAVRASGGRDTVVCPLIDARHGQVYAGIFEVTWRAGWPEVNAIQPDWAGPVGDVAQYITGPTVFAGDALPLAARELAPTLKDNFLAAPAHHTLPHPEEVALLAAARAAAGKFDDPVALEPHYVRQTYTSRGAAKS